MHSFHVAVQLARLDESFTHFFQRRHLISHAIKELKPGRYERFGYESASGRLSKTPHPRKAERQIALICTYFRRLAPGVLLDHVLAYEHP